MKTKLEKLTEQSKNETHIARPAFYSMKDPAEKEELKKLLDENSDIRVYDEILGQAEELVKSKNPKKVFSKTELTEAAKKHLGSNPWEYGVWVYYPWSKRLVHILGEEEFVEVRTNRNQYKITPEEKAILATKKIGVIGLSVGQSIALTIAMERICGELRIADFDILELSNLNRIRAGVHNLGIPKTIVVTREILEIDPYLRVTYYSDGLTEENVDDFFMKDGKLDVCIEVCDGLYTKIFARQKAKEHRIPIVMNSSDKGTTDIERYDLEPEQPILHGLIDHLDLSLVKQAKTNEEKVPYLLPMLGVETSTERLKASMLEIQETITTWPQLASGVVLGGGICADVCRRIMLDELKDSGRYFVDLEALICDGKSHAMSEQQIEKAHQIPETNIKDYEEALKEAEQKNIFSGNEKFKELNDHEIKALVNAAILAPSGGNIQPWKWHYRDKCLLLFHEKNRRNSILNYKNSASFIALGAAAENLILQAHEIKREVTMQLFPLGRESDLTAVFKFPESSDQSTEGHESDELVYSVRERITNRVITKRAPFKKEESAYLLNAIKAIEGAELKIFTDEKVIDEIKKILVRVDQLYLTSKSGNYNFNSELRWTSEEAEKTRDGVDINTLDITPTELAGLTVSRSWEVTRYLNDWRKGEAFGKITGKAIDAASALGLITMPDSGASNYFRAGRAIQKVWLASSKLNLSFQPISISMFLFARANDGNKDGIKDIKEELVKLSALLNNVCGVDENRNPVFLFRLGYGGKPRARALRIPIESVLMNE